MVGKRTGTGTGTTVNKTEQPLEAVLSALGLEVAKAKVGSELEQYVQHWIQMILQSDAPEHQAIRSELISNVSRLMATKTLQQCLMGAIADSQAALEAASNLE